MNNNKEMTATTKGINTSGRKGKKVLCVETNEIFNSATEAAKKVGCCKSMMTQVCREEKTDPGCGAEGLLQSAGGHRAPAGGHR